MVENKLLKMIDFKPITIEDRPFYEGLLLKMGERGCEYSFANLYLWGRQRIARHGEGVVFFSQFDRKSVYPFPIGCDGKSAVDAIIEDAHARDIPCRITGVTDSDRQQLELLFDGRFRYHCDEENFDYVYAIDDLAELSGKKYHSKKNHLNRFIEERPDHKVEPICEDNIPLVKNFLDEWYAERETENPRGDFHMERAALDRALRHYFDLELEGLVIFDGDDILAITIGSRLSDNTFDVHFEKARSDVNGAYTAINYYYARYVRDKYPSVRFLNREEDMGLEGLRRAKRSYKPHHMVEKHWACLLEDGYDY